MWNVCYTKGNKLSSLKDLCAKHRYRLFFRVVYNILLIPEPCVSLLEDACELLYLFKTFNTNIVRGFEI